MKSPMLFENEEFAHRPKSKEIPEAPCAPRTSGIGLRGLGADGLAEATKPAPPATALAASPPVPSSSFEAFQRWGGVGVPEPRQRSVRPGCTTEAQRHRGTEGAVCQPCASDDSGVHPEGSISVSPRLSGWLSGPGSSLRGEIGRSGHPTPTPSLWRSGSWTQPPTPHSSVLPADHADPRRSEGPVPGLGPPSERTADPR